MGKLLDQAVVEGAAALSPDQIAGYLDELPDWVLVDDGRAIRREWRFRGFKQAAALANLAAWQAEAANHHPEIAFGWGHASVTFTTHSAQGVTLNDLILAARLDRALG